jgi:hypothetical protein
MGRTREWKKRLSRSQWFAAYRAQRDSLFYGAGTSEIVWLTRRGKSRPVRVELRPYSSKYGGDSECLTRFDLNFADGVTPVTRELQKQLSLLRDEYASVLDGLDVKRKLCGGRSFTDLQPPMRVQSGDPEDA